MALRPSISQVPCVPVASGREQRSDFLKFIYFAVFFFLLFLLPKHIAQASASLPLGPKAHHLSPGPLQPPLPLHSPCKPGPAGPHWKRKSENVTSRPCFKPSVGPSCTTDDVSMAHKDLCHLAPTATPPPPPWALLLGLCTCCRNILSPGLRMADCGSACRLLRREAQPDPLQGCSRTSHSARTFLTCRSASRLLSCLQGGRSSSA